MNILIIITKIKSWKSSIVFKYINILIIIAKWTLIIISQNSFIY